MAYKKVSGSRTAEIQLDGSVYTVDFGCSYNYYAVRNDSDSTIYVSTTDKSCTPNNDGVVSIPSGGGYVHYNGFGGSPEIFISGMGGALVIAQDDGVCPFKRAQKGGDGNAGSSILPHPEGLAAYFDYSKNVSETGWTDIVSGLQINADMLLNSDSVSIAPSQSTGAPINLDLTDAFTIYVIFKFTQNTDGWWSVCANYGVTPQFNLCAHDKCIAIGAGETSGAYTSTIAAANYHICAMTFLNGMGCLYIDGIKKHESHYYHSPVTAKYLLCDGSNLKAMAFFDNVAQSPTFIAENTNYLAQKYGIEI